MLVTVVPTFAPITMKIAASNGTAAAATSATTSDAVSDELREIAVAKIPTNTATTGDMSGPMPRNSRAVSDPISRIATPTAPTPARNR